MMLLIYLPILLALHHLILYQMASALGQEDQLLEMLCQPAEVHGFTEIPKYVKFIGF